MAEFEEKVATRLRDIRGHRSQSVFARQTSAPQTTISKYEREGVPNSWRWLARLRDEEGVDLNELLTNKDNGR